MLSLGSLGVGSFDTSMAAASWLNCFFVLNGVGLLSRRGVGVEWNEAKKK